MDYGSLTSEWKIATAQFLLVLEKSLFSIDGQNIKKRFINLKISIALHQVQKVQIAEYLAVEFRVFLRKRCQQILRCLKLDKK